MKQFSSYNGLKNEFKIVQIHLCIDAECMYIINLDITAVDNTAFFKKKTERNDKVLDECMSRPRSDSRRERNIVRINESQREKGIKFLQLCKY